MKDASRPGRKPTLSAKIVARILQKTTQEKPVNATHWSTRSMEKAVGVSKDAVWLMASLAEQTASSASRARSLLQGPRGRLFEPGDARA